MNAQEPKSSPPTQRAVLVIGMHRSGTSVLSRLLNVLGFYLGDNLLPPKKDNPMGFWEDIDIIELNDQILEKLGYRWYSVTNSDDLSISEEDKSEFIQQIERLVKHKFSTHSRIAIKDPRLTLLKNLWLDALKNAGFEIDIVAVIRDPLSVANSLKERNGFDINVGLQLWFNYNYSIICQQNTDFIVVDFDRFLDNPSTQIDRLIHYLRIDQNKSGVETDIDHFKSEFIKRELRHHTNVQEFIPSNRSYINSLFSLFRKWSKQSHLDSNNIREACDAIRKEACSLSDDNQITELTFATQQQDIEISLLKSNYSELLKTSEWLREKWEENNDEIAYLKDKIEIDTSYRSKDNSYPLSETFFDYLKGMVRDKLKSAHYKISLKKDARRAKIHAYKSLRSHRLSGIARRRLPGVEQSSKILHEKKKEFEEHHRERLDDFLRSGDTIFYPSQDNPKVSVILVLYNRAELTLACLKSIEDNLSTAFEVIIIDNASTDKTPQLLNRLSGIKLIKNSTNVGFLKACNQVRGKARGDYLLFLNNDAELLPGTIEEAISAAESDTKVGAVGGKILLLDGKLQEAGSIVWSDGSCLGYGRGDDPDLPQYNFRREVDYCSGAFLVTPSKLFHELGGFDERFAPAYYEETDYCVRLAKKGYKTIYEPRAVIKHFEFASSPSSGKALQLQQVNKERFFDKHTQWLERSLDPSPKNVIFARTSNRFAKRILYIDDRVPHIYYGSGFPRANFFINSLIELGCHVTIYPLNFPDEETWSSAYTDIPKTAEIMRRHGRAHLAQHLVTRSGYYDTIWVSRPHNMEYFNEVIKYFKAYVQSSTIIYDSEAIFALRNTEKAAIGGRSINERQMQNDVNAELTIANRADKVVTVSEMEKAHFMKAGFSNVHVLGHALSTRKSIVPFEERHGFMFAGNLDYDESPNVDSILWFIRAVWPAIRTRVPGAILHIVGSTQSRYIRELGQDDIEVHGRVDDLRPIYDSCRVFVAPTRFSAGIPFKIHEAAANGVPVVATSILIRQLGWKNGDQILGSDAISPNQFSRQCIKLHEHKHIWTRIRDNALATIREQCCPYAVRQRLSELIGLTPK